MRRHIYFRIVKTINCRYYGLAIDQGDIGWVDSGVWADQLTTALEERKRGINIRFKAKKKNPLILVGLYHAFDRHPLFNGNVKGGVDPGRDRMKPHFGADEGRENSA